MAGKQTNDEAMWERLVKNMLRAEMMRRGVSYGDLVERLEAVGITDSVPNLRNKVARGRFTAPFFAQCMVALGVQSLQIPSLEDVSVVDAGEHGAQSPSKRGPRS